MSLNDYLGLLVEVDGATSIYTILLVDVKAWSFPPYIYVLIPLGKAPQNYCKGSPCESENSIFSYLYYYAISKGH